jgi:hypothetical protein
MNNIAMAPAWRRSSRCDSSTCVEARFTGDGVEMRDSKHPTGPVLRFTRGQWTTFIADVIDRAEGR